MIRILRPLVGLAILAVASCAIAQTRPSRAAKNEPAPLPPGIQAGVDVLIREMEAVVKDPANTGRRGESNYFAHSKESLDQDAMLDILSRRLYRNKNSNIEAVVDTYVKWQLLSLQKTPFDEAHTKEARQVYAGTALFPFPTPTDPSIKGDVGKLKPEEIGPPNGKWREELDNHFKIVGVLIDYRNDLYARLPRTLDTVRAGFDDAYDRIQKSYYDPKFNDRLANDLRTVAAGAKPVQIGQMASFVQSISGKSGPKAHRDIVVSSKKTVYWRMYTPEFDKKKFDQLASDLTTMAKAGF